MIEAASTEPFKLSWFFNAKLLSFSAYFPAARFAIVWTTSQKNSHKLAACGYKMDTTVSSDNALACTGLRLGHRGIQIALW